MMIGKEEDSLTFIDDKTSPSSMLMENATYFTKYGYEKLSEVASALSEIEWAENAKRVKDRIVIFSEGKVPPATVDCSEYESFMGSHSLEKRLELNKTLRKQYPKYIAIIVEKRYGSKLPNINKRKYLVNGSSQIGTFVRILCNNYITRFSSSQMIWLSTHDGVMFAPCSETIDFFYAKNKSADGFLYLLYDEENTFG